MLENQQYSLIPSPENHVERRLDFIHVALATILDNLPIQRRPLSEWTKQLILKTVWLKRGGYCPCCQLVRICDADGKLPNLEFDHFINRARNEPEACWACCSACNRALESPAFKNAHRSEFESYQHAMQGMLHDRQRELEW